MRRRLGKRKEGNKSDMHHKGCEHIRAVGFHFRTCRLGSSRVEDAAFVRSSIQRDLRGRVAVLRGSTTDAYPTLHSYSPLSGTTTLLSTPNTTPTPYANVRVLL